MVVRKVALCFLMGLLVTGWMGFVCACEKSFSQAKLDWSVLAALKPLFKGPMKGGWREPSIFKVVTKEWGVDKTFVRSLERKEWVSALLWLNIASPDPNYEPTFYHYGLEDHSEIARSMYYNRYYPLHICVAGGGRSLPVVKKLLERGATPFCLTCESLLYERTPLLMSAYRCEKVFSHPLSLTLLNAMLQEMANKGISAATSLPLKPLPNKLKPQAKYEIQDIFKACADLLLLEPQYNKTTSVAGELAKRYLNACFMAKKNGVKSGEEGKDLLTEDEDEGEYDELLAPDEEPFITREEAPYITTQLEDFLQDKYFTQSPKDFYFSLKSAFQKKDGSGDEEEKNG
ncbi:TPA: hypothetical protein DDZ86_00585 [Candidatus Dependentiae bacterium]|nr:MAG: hypothetical protein UW09_C0002G0011 [candidate division TM6 bacterium GW2011_GWF2_43_87]HBL98120.1 hypothetical protein [Candidatus Dependentiae bacterium]